jgi:hypothetical protein
LIQYELIVYGLVKKKMNDYYPKYECYANVKSFTSIYK